MNRQHYLETIEKVLTFDLPEAAFADAINQHFNYLANLTGDVNDNDIQLQ